MNLVRSMMILATGGFVAAVTITAQGPPPQPAGTGITMAKTWTDDDYDKIMKEVGATFGMLRKSIEGQNAESAKQQAGRLEELFEQADDFWNSRNVDDAEDWADDAAEHADHVEDAVDAKDFAKAAEHAKLLQGTCASCHTKYRDKAPDGQFRIRP